jgi:hypothetical protein
LPAAPDSWLAENQVGLAPPLAPPQQPPGHDDMLEGTMPLNQAAPGAGCGAAENHGVESAPSELGCPENQAGAGPLMPADPEKYQGIEGIEPAVDQAGALCGEQPHA